MIRDRVSACTYLECYQTESLTFPVMGSHRNDPAAKPHENVEVFLLTFLSFFLFFFLLSIVDEVTYGVCLIATWIFL